VTRILSLLFALTLQTSGNWPTLAQELADARVPLPPRVDGGGRITSFATFADDRSYLIAYYDLVADGLLHTLNVRAYDRRTGQWRVATFDEIGSVMLISRAGATFCIEGHTSPSSGPLLVLSADLTRRHITDGWIVFTAPDGRALFVRGMRHFAPTHAEVLAMYDPSANRDVSIYPAASNNDRGSESDGGIWIDRTIGAVAPGRRANTVEFPVTVQRMRVESDNLPHEAGAKEQRQVTCDLSPRVPVCREEPHADHP
jgi:hypothetical protein